MKWRRGFAIQRLMNAMRQAHADGWFIVFDTLTLADDRLESFYDNPNALRDYFRDIGRIVFFFQAEDGIRDDLVTGVQTCALPIFSPGLIDLHTHVYWGGTSLGVEAELLARTGGVTTFIDAGSAGPGNFHGFRKHVIEPSAVRILPYLNVPFPGIFAFSKSVMVGENSDMRLIEAREAVRVAREHKALVLGIKGRVGRSASRD